MNINRHWIILVSAVISCFFIGLANAFIVSQPASIFGGNGGFIPLGGGGTVSVGSGAATPGSNSNTNNSSTSVQPLMHPQVWSPQVTSAMPNISSGQYSTLPICPSTPSNCPDINGNGGNMSTCPDACQVTRVPLAINFFYPGNVTMPLCPIGYSQVASFDVQQEAIYQQGQGTTPITGGMTQFSSLASNAPNTGVTFSTGSWSGTFSNPDLGNWSCPAPNTGDKFDANSWNNWVIIYGGNVVQVMSQNTDNCGCAGTCLTCVCGAAGSHTRVTSVVLRLVYYNVPQGYVPTGRFMPQGVVCVRPKTTWQQLH